MPLNILKLCVGVGEPSELVDHHQNRLATMTADGRVPELVHTTRTMPRRRDEVLAGGSLYWVIRGYIQIRQPISDLRAVVGKDGIERCQIVLEPVHQLTELSPRRPFQGWRYLDASDAPPDIGESRQDGLPAELRRELAELGIL